MSTILNENSPKVNKILLGYASDYRSKSIGLTGRVWLMTSQLIFKHAGVGPIAFFSPKYMVS